MKKYLAEFIGTFSLVLIGCGSAVVAGKTIPITVADAPSGIGLLGISLAFGLAVVAMAYAIGPISGCHLNPAITVAMLVAKKISIADSIGYIIAQFIGATVAACALMAIQKGAPGFSMGEWALGSNGWGPGYLGNYTTTAAFITEVLLTFIFLFVIFGATSRLGNPNMAGLAIGFTLVIINMVGIPITGTSVNPARSFGPAVLAGGKAFQQLWLFMIAPVIGGILAAILWRTVFEPKHEA